MPFRNERQRALVCQTLLAQVGLPELWSARGPNVEAQRRIQGELDRFSKARTTVLFTCWALWDGSGLAAVSDLLSLPGPNLRAVAELLQAVAQGPGDVDDWVRRWHGRPRALVA